MPLAALLEMFDTPALSCSLFMVQSTGVALVISPSNAPTHISAPYYDPLI